MVAPLHSRAPCGCPMPCAPTLPAGTCHPTAPARRSESLQRPCRRRRPLRLQAPADAPATDGAGARRHRTLRTPYGQPRLAYGLFRTPDTGSPLPSFLLPSLRFAPAHHESSAAPPTPPCTRAAALSSAPSSNSSMAVKPSRQRHLGGESARGEAPAQQPSISLTRRTTRAVVAAAPYQRRDESFVCRPR